MRANGRASEGVCLCKTVYVLCVHVCMCDDALKCMEMNVCVYLHVCFIITAIIPLMTIHYNHHYFLLSLYSDYHYVISTTITISP